MCFRKSPSKVYWAAKMMEDFFNPPNSGDKHNFFPSLSDTYVVTDPGESINDIYKYIDTKFLELDEAFLIKDEYWVLKKSTKMRGCHIAASFCDEQTEIPSKDPKDLDNSTPAKNSPFNFKVSFALTQ